MSQPWSDFSLCHSYTFGYGVPNQDGVWLSRCEVANISSGPLFIRCVVSNVLSGPQSGSGFGDISLIFVSLNEGGLISFPGFNKVSIITPFIYSQ